MDNNQIKNFIESSRKAGIKDEKIVSFLQSKGVDLSTGQTPQTKKPIESFTGSSKSPFQSTGEENIITGTAKAVGNLPRSTYELGKNVVSAVTNPVETGKSLFNIVKGIGAKTGEKLLENTDVGQMLLQKANENRIANGVEPLKTDASGKIQVEDTPELQAINQIGTFITDRYGSLDKFKETAIEDPAGVLADLATVISGGGAAISKVGTISKVGEIAKVGSTISKAGQALEPVTSVTKTLGKGKDIIAKSKVGQIAGEVIPKATDLQKTQVTKALDLTPGDLTNIKKATGNDVTEFIIEKNLLKGTPEEIADALNETRIATKELVRSEVGKVKKIYTPEQVPGVVKGLNTILEGVDGISGLENVADEIRTLSKKSKFTLSDVQRAKELIDENSNIYSKIGDVKSSATARGLDNTRKGIRKFIEDEVNTSTQGATDIFKLNNDVQTTYAIEDAINNRAAKGITKSFISPADSLVLFGGGATFSPAVGIGLYLGKKIIESPSFRLAYTKALSAQPIQKIKTLLKEVKNKNVSPETQKLINQLADEAKNNLQVIESGSTVLEKSKSKQ